MFRLVAREPLRLGHRRAQLPAMAAPIKAATMRVPSAGAQLRTLASAASAQQGLPALQVNGSRLMDSIHSTCEFGKAHPYGE